MHRMLLAALLAAGTLASPTLAADLRIGLQDDPDVLDPDQSRTFVGRIVYTSLCNKLVDITPELKIIPQLATGWSWSDEIGRAHVCTPVTNAHLVCRLLLEKNKQSNVQIPDIAK